MYNGIQNVPWYFLALKKEQVIRKQQKLQCFTLQRSTGSQKESFFSFCGECHAIECAL